ncbi:unnamed protein product [Absidia cylindrospora]
MLHRSDVCRFDDPEQAIRDVGLVKPKPGIFGDHIHYVLVVTTPHDIFLLGVGLRSSNNQPATGSMNVFATELYASSEGIEMSSIHGTDNGRIFMCGANGHLYELNYNHPDSWSRYCGIYCWTQDWISRLSFRSNSPGFKYITIDDERNVLYASSSQSFIEIFYLGLTKNEFIRIAKNTDIVNSASLVCRQNSIPYTHSDFIIKHLHVVPTAESRKIHLVAVTESGFRLYFSHQRDALRSAYVYPSNIKMIPNALELVHIRPPPPPPPPQAFPFNQVTSISTNLNASYYDCGIFLASQPLNDELDTITISSAAIGNAPIPSNDFNTGYQPYQSSYIETVFTFPANGKVWAIAETDAPNKGKHSIYDIDSQLIDQPRKFLVLTDRGLTFFNKQRPVDILYNILSDSVNNIETSRHDLLVFSDQYGLTQVCAMCLSIVCANYAYGSIEQGDIGTRAAQLFFEIGGHPAPRATGNQLGQTVNQANVIYSNKHDALVLHFSRLVSGIWKTKVFEINSEMKQVNFSTRIQSMLLAVQTNLSLLKRFMDENPEFHTITSIQNIKLQSNDNSMVQLLLAEQQSVHGIYELLKQCIEAISFIDFVIDANIKDVLLCTPESIRCEMMEMSLESMLASSRGVALKRDLVIAAIIKYGSTHVHAGSDVVSDFLQRKCPSFFSASDMAFYKGMESLTCALKADVDYERTIALEESLKYFQNASDSITDDILVEICDKYRYQCYYVGVVKLALERAKRLDPQELGLAYVESNRSLSTTTIQEDPSSDDSRKRFYLMRRRCYDHILQSLNDVRQLQQGVPVVVYGRQIYDSNPDLMASTVLATALSSDDRLFHYTLYDQFLMASKNDNDVLMELLSVDNKYIVPFVREYVDGYTGMNFLWQYYRRREQYYEAALCLEALAMEPLDLPTNKRMEYLGLAIVNAGSRDLKHLENVETTELLQRLKQQMEHLKTQTTQ